MNLIENKYKELQKWKKVLVAGIFTVLGSFVLGILILPLLLFPIGILLVVIGALKYTKVSKAVKGLMGEYFSSKGINVKYIPNPNNDEALNMILESGLISNIYDYHNKIDDYFAGVYKGTPYCFFDFKYYYIVRSNNSSSTRTIISGTFFKIKLNVNIDCNLIIREKNFHRKIEIENLYNIATNNEAFNQKYMIQTDDHLKGLEALNENIIDGLLEIEKKYDGLFFISIKNDYVYVILGDFQDHFEFSRKGLDSLLKDYYDLLTVVENVKQVFEK